MRTLLIPCAGSRKINHRPVFMNIHPDGKLLAEKCLEGIFPETYDRIVFALLDEIDKEYNATEVILSSMGETYPVEVVRLPRETIGPADTVSQSIELAGIKGEFAIRDCLNSIQLEKNTYGNFVSGLDLTTYNQDVYKVRTKSFIVLNEQNQILDIIEKKFRSDVISVGLYGFKSTDDYKTAYKRLTDPNYPIKKLYISNIISFLIGYNQRVFQCVSVIRHEDWGSLETWNQLQRRYATCFIDADSLIGEILSDRNTEKLINAMIKEANKQMCYIVFTAGNVDGETLKNVFSEKRINCVGVVSGVSQSNKKTIVSNADELKTVSMGV